MKKYYVSYLFKSGAAITTTMNGNNEHEVLLKAKDMFDKASANNQFLILNNTALDTDEVVAIDVYEDNSCGIIEES